MRDPHGFPRNGLCEFTGIVCRVHCARGSVDGSSGCGYHPSRDRYMVPCRVIRGCVMRVPHGGSGLRNLCCACGCLSFRRSVLFQCFECLWRLGDCGCRTCVVRAVADLSGASLRAARYLLVLMATYSVSNFGFTISSVSPFGWYTG